MLASSPSSCFHPAVSSPSPSAIFRQNSSDGSLAPRSETVPNPKRSPTSRRSVKSSAPSSTASTAAASSAIIAEATYSRVPVVGDASVPKSELENMTVATSTAPNASSTVEEAAVCIEHAPESSVKRRQDLETPSSVSPSADSASNTKKARPGQSTKKTLPARYELCLVEDIVILIADMISELIETNDPLPLRDGGLTRFHSRTPPGISVVDYLQRLAKHATLTPPLLLSMVYYIDRLCSLYPAFTITTLTVHRFLITAATVAAKGLSDSFWNNVTYARVGGVRVAELGLLELEFLYRVDWKIVPDPEVLVDYYGGLVERSNKYVMEEEPKISQDDPGRAAARNGTNQLLGERDSKWEAWMKDVADISNSASSETATLDRNTAQ